VIAKGFILLPLGIPVYVFMRWRERATLAPAATPAEPTLRPQPTGD
jgi:hypothetical protein